MGPARMSPLATAVLLGVLMWPVISTGVSTCGDLKSFYQSEECCGFPSKSLSEDPFGCHNTVTMEQVLAAQKAWGDGIVAISSAHTNGGDFEQVATDHIQTLYGYGLTPVLFKPTLAAEQQFRSDFDGALSYFVATNNASEEDSGFAIKGWTAVRFENDDIILSGSTASAMGNYFFTGPTGNETKVEYSFCYFLDADDNLRINLHHSSMPYVSPAV